MRFVLEADTLVLNLIINGLPSILKKVQADDIDVTVLNLIINGLPSIQMTKRLKEY